ncbi:MAG TPA: PilZ domain-containing protein [bacterium]|nr:PilZ domain-containing protein [bacterium]
MKRRSKNIERRKHPRFFPDKNNQPQVSFIFEDDAEISVEVVNISRGGMLASTQQMEHFLEIDRQKIKLIKIVPPNRPPFRCAGKLLRLHPIREDKTCYCAVEFTKLTDEDFSESTSATAESTPQNKTAVDLPLEQSEVELLQRIDSAANYLEQPHSEKATQLRQQVYESFSDIADHLPVEDKWLFFELLDEMISHRPLYPVELKADFLKISRQGIKARQALGARQRLGLIKKPTKPD